MSYTTSYSALVTEVKSYVDSQNDEFVAQLPNIINRALHQVQRDLDLDIWSTFQTHHLTAGSVLYARDPSWLFVKSWHLPSVGVFIEKRSLDYVRMYGGKSGIPKAYADRSETHYQFSHTPRDNYTSELQVVIKLPSLSTSNETNWITENAADLLLLATLVGCESYLVAPERVAEFTALYQALTTSAYAFLSGEERSGYTPMRKTARPV